MEKSERFRIVIIFKILRLSLLHLLKETINILLFFFLFFFCVLQKIPR